MTTPSRLHPLLRGIAPLVLLSAAGCLGGQVGEEQVVCAPVRREPLALDQASPLGFTGQELVEAAVGSSEADVTWADGATTTLTLDVAYTGTLEFQDREWLGDDDGAAEIELGDCDDVLMIGLRVDADTDDGALAEGWEVEALALTGDEVSFSRELDEVDGSLAIETFAPDTDWDSVRGWIDLTVGVAGVDGSIDGQTSSEDGSVASAEGFDIATIGEPQETP